MTQLVYGFEFKLDGIEGTSKIKVFKSRPKMPYFTVGGETTAGLNHSLVGSIRECIAKRELKVATSLSFLFYQKL